MAADVIMEEDVPSSSAIPPQDSGILDDMDQGPSPCDQDDGSYPPPPPPEPQRSVNAPVIPIRPPIDNRANRPQRKIGLFLCGQETNSVRITVCFEDFFDTTCSVLVVIECLLQFKFGRQDNTFASKWERMTILLLNFLLKKPAVNALFHFYDFNIFIFRFYLQHFCRRDLLPNLKR